MKHFYLKFTLLLVFFLWIGNLTAQITVGFERNTTQNIPIDYTGYSYSQSIYLQTEIRGAGNITTISWYYNHAPNSGEAQDIVIWMGHTSREDFVSNSSWIDIADLTHVYTGTLARPTASGWVSITLDNAFNYNNTDNLIIAVDDNTLNSAPDMDNFYCSRVDNARTIQYNSGLTNPNSGIPPTPPSRLHYIPNIILGGITATCAVPSRGIATNEAPTNVDLFWDAGGNESVWNIEYGVAGFSQGNGREVRRISNPHSLSGLSPNTSYDYYIQADCGGQDESLWAGPFHFTTGCLALTAPFKESFDVLDLTPPYTALPNCWEPQIGDDYWLVTDNITNASSSLGIDDHTSGNGNYMWSNIGNEENGMVTPMIDLTDLTGAYVGFSFVSSNLINNLSHTINLDVWDGAAWINIVSMTGLFDDWTEVGGIVPEGMPAVTKFRIYATENPNSVGSNGFYNQLGIDDFFVRQMLTDNVELTVLTTEACSIPENITIEIKNVGTNTQTRIPVSYSIDGGTPVIEEWEGILESGQSVQYTFVIPFNAIISNSYDISASTNLATDGDATNDSLTINHLVAPIFNSSFVEDFENGMSPFWTTNGSIGLNNTFGSNTLSANVYSGPSPVFTATTPKIVVSATDSVSFDYQYVDYLTSSSNFRIGDTMNLQVSTDCGVTFTTIRQIYSDSDIASNGFSSLSYDLSAYASQTVIFRILATTVTGAYSLSIDNFFVGIPLTKSVTFTDASCIDVSNGTGTITAAGGLTPYTYTWSNGETTAAAVNLSGGVNYYTITDAFGTTIIDSVTIGTAIVMSSTISVDATVSCHASTDGAVSVLPANGIAPYTFNWANGATTDSLTNISAGLYTVTITDSNNCATVTSVTLTEPNGIITTSTTNANVLCNGVNGSGNGSATVIASGGSGEFTYLWENGSTMSTVSGLSGGIYTVTVTDANGCTKPLSMTITEPTALGFSITTTSDSVGLGIGQILTGVTGGEAPYTFTWNGVVGGDSLSNLMEGTYALVVTDANGCSIDTVVSIANNTVSTNQIDYVSDLSIYPNPTQGNTIIDLELSQNADVAVSIYTVTGVLIQNFGMENTSKLNKQIDLSQYAEGLYLVRFSIDNKVVTKKLLVTK